MMSAIGDALAPPPEEIARLAGRPDAVPLTLPIPAQLPRAAQVTLPDIAACGDGHVAPFMDPRSPGGIPEGLTARLVVPLVIKFCTQWVVPK